MSVEDEWKGDAGAEVRNRAASVQRAERNVEEAKAALQSAYDELKAAERDFDTAKRVYSAAQQDQSRLVRAPRVSQQKQEWLKALAIHEVFGASEMREAAEQIGWSPSDGTLRTLASDYRNAGYFIGVSHGVMRLGRDRITAAVGGIFDSRPDPETRISTGPDEDDDLEDRNPDPNERRSSEAYDEYDEDLPF